VVLLTDMGQSRSLDIVRVRTYNKDDDDDDDDSTVRETQYELLTSYLPSMITISLCLTLSET